MLLGSHLLARKKKFETMLDRISSLKREGNSEDTARSLRLDDIGWIGAPDCPRCKGPPRHLPQLYGELGRWNTDLSANNSG